MARSGKCHQWVGRGAGLGRAGPHTLNVVDIPVGIDSTGGQVALFWMFIGVQDISQRLRNTRIGLRAAQLDNDAQLLRVRFAGGKIFSRVGPSDYLASGWTD